MVPFTVVVCCGGRKGIVVGESAAGRGSVPREWSRPKALIKDHTLKFLYMSHAHK